MMSTEKLAWMMGAHRTGFAKAIEDACIRWGITDGRDKVRFIAQMHVETSGFLHLAELTNYSATGLMKVFPGRNGLNLDIAKRLVAAGPRSVFNFVYGGKWGRENLGNIEPDDGWDYRGRSAIMTTGRENYRKTSIGCWGDLRLIENPGLLEMPENAFDAAGWYWNSRKINGIDDIREVTRRINPGLMHLDRRIGKTNEGYDLLDLLTNH